MPPSIKPVPKFSATDYDCLHRQRMPGVFEQDTHSVYNGADMKRRGWLAYAIITALNFMECPAMADDLADCTKAKGDGGIRACSRLIESGKYRGRDLATLHYNRALWFRQQTNTDAALADITTAINLAPDDPSLAGAYNIRAQSWHNKHQYVRAFADYSRAIQLSPKQAYLYWNRGKMRTQGGDFDGAISDLSESLRLEPKQLGALSMRGLAWFQKEEFDHAIPDFDQVIKIDPKGAFAYAVRGAAWRGKGDFSRALADQDRAVELNGQSTTALLERGNTWHAKGDYDRAADDYSRAIVADANYSMAYAKRGIAYESKGDMERARADFNSALAISKKYVDEEAAHNIAREHLTLAPASVAGFGASTSPNSPSVPKGPRIALLIGNSNYSNFTKIPNPINDATDLARTLKGLGFEVIVGTDLRRSEMEDIFIRFAKKVRESETTLVYYAGHGLQHQGINYLVPTDAKIDDEADLRKLVNLQHVISDLQNAGRVRILIVDACRDNEAIQQLAIRLPQSRSAAFDRGLARVTGADGTLIAFATQPNRVAADGAGRNSPFAQALIKHLPTPGLELRTLLTRVRAEVVAATDGAQRPEVWDSMIGEFAFSEAPR